MGFAKKQHMYLQGLGELVSYARTYGISDIEVIKYVLYYLGYELKITPTLKLMRIKKKEWFK